MTRSGATRLLARKPTERHVSTQVIDGVAGVQHSASRGRLTFRLDLARRRRYGDNPHMDSRPSSKELKKGSADLLILALLEGAIGTAMSSAD